MATGRGHLVAHVHVLPLAHLVRGRHRGLGNQLHADDADD